MALVNFVIEVVCEYIPCDMWFLLLTLTPDCRYRRKKSSNESINIRLLWVIRHIPTTKFVVFKCKKIKKCFKDNVFL